MRLYFLLVIWWCAAQNTMGSWLFRKYRSHHSLSLSIVGFFCVLICLYFLFSIWFGRSSSPAFNFTCVDFRTHISSCEVLRATSYLAPTDSASICVGFFLISLVSESASIWWLRFFFNRLPSDYQPSSSGLSGNRCSSQSHHLWPYTGHPGLLILYSAWLIFLLLVSCLLSWSSCL